jgi:D-arabinose 1-dehydrogenase-like Zn-dependent alcohol dehydrogenase
VVAADDTMEKAVAMIREATGGTGVDGAIEFTGNRALFRLAIDCLRLGGTLVPVGADWSGAPIPIADQEFTRLELSIRGIRASRLNDQRIVLDLLAKKKIAPHIFAVLPLAEIARAHEMLERGEITGRIVLDPWRKV